MLDFITFEFIVKATLILIVFVMTLGIAAYSTLAERKVSAFLQDRIGPNRAGIFGLLQPLADAGKMFFKEEFIPANSSKFLFILGPSLAMVTAMMSSAVIPFGDKLIFGTDVVNLMPVEANIGILYIFGVVSLGVYGVMIGGWASNNKFSLLGAIRAASQNISYELAMGLSIIAVLMMSGSLAMGDIVAKQHGFLNWNIFAQPIGFVIFCTCAFAECNRTPFDLPECESELVGGYHTEYSSMKLGLYLFSEYVNMFVAGLVMSTLYFGGYDYPFSDFVFAQFGQNVATIIGFLGLVGKGIAFIFFFMWIRWTVPRFRYDQLMNLGWTSLIPLAIVNVILTGGAIMVKDMFFK